MLRCFIQRDFLWMFSKSTEFIDSVLDVAKKETEGCDGLQSFLPAPRGLPQVEITFNIDTSGTLIVSARDESAYTV